MNSGSGNLWREQVMAIMRLEIKKNFLARRGLWIYLLALAPVLLFAGHSFERLRHGRVCDLGQDNLIFATVFLIGAWKLFGQAIWHLDVWREKR